MAQIQFTSDFEDEIAKEIEALSDEAKLSLVEMFEELIQVAVFHSVSVNGSSTVEKLQNAVEVGSAIARLSLEDSALVEDLDHVECCVVSKEPVDFLCCKCGQRDEWGGDPLRHVYLYHFKRQV